MEHVVLVIHLIVTLAMIILIMLQRSEGGGLGIGSSGGMGNFASAQTTGNVLTKLTTYAAMIFFVTSIILAIMAARGGATSSILDAASQDVPAITAPATPSAADAAAVDAKTKPSEPPTVPIAK
jgi:preprotein translocase subunit SecG